MWNSWNRPSIAESSPQARIHRWACMHKLHMHAFLAKTFFFLLFFPPFPITCTQYSLNALSHLTRFDYIHRELSGYFRFFCIDIAGQVFWHSFETALATCPTGVKLSVDTFPLVLNSHPRGGFKL